MDLMYLMFFVALASTIHFWLCFITKLVYKDFRYVNRQIFSTSVMTSLLVYLWLYNFG